MQNTRMKKQISDAFFELSSEKSPTKVSVKEICDALNINRKTFYYHFPSKEIMVNWIFRRDLGHALSDKFPRSQLVFEPRDSSPYANYPYYVFIKDDQGRLNHSQFFLTMSECFSDKRAFYADLMKTSEPGSLRAYLFDLYRKALHKDLQFIFKDYADDDDAVSFMSEFYAAAFLGQFARRIMSHDSCRTLEEVRPFGNIIHDSMYLTKMHLDSGATLRRTAVLPELAESERCHTC